MALQATRAKASAAAETLARSKSAQSAASDPIALDLAPLIAPHKKQGRVAIRVERMPQTARLSQGRNNGAGSWSLAQDELDDLTYLPPQGATGQHTLAIRIIGSEGATLAVHDVHVHTGAGGAKAEWAPPKNARNQQNSDHIRILERERDALKAKLAAREAEATAAISRAATALDELKELRSRPDAKDVLTQAQKEWNASAQARLEALDAQWEKRFSDAQAQAERERNALERTRSNADASELLMLRGALQDAHAEIAARGAALVNANEARAEEIVRFERARNDAHATAEAEWQAAETARMVAAQQAWAREAEVVRAALSQKCERLAEDLALARKQLPAETTDGDRQKIAGLQAELAASNAEVAKARALTVAERAGWKSQSDAQLANARKEWGEAEVSRLADARAQWQEEAERILAAAVARYREAEKSLAQLRDDAPQLAQANEVSQLRNECTSLQMSLTKREREFESLRLTQEEAARTLAAAVARYHGAEESLAQLRAEAPQAAQADEVSQLRSECTSLQTSLTKSESELESLRLAQEESARTLAAAVARYHGAEESLAQLRVEAPQAAQADEVSQLREECTSLQIALAKRESELEHFRLMTKTQIPPSSKNTVTLHGDSEWRAIDQEEPKRKISPVLVAQIVGVVVIAAMVVFALPYLESSLPYDWQYDIDSTFVNIEAAIGMQTPAPQATSALPVRQTIAAALGDAIVAHSTKLHAKPTKSSDVLASLRRGTPVAVMERRNGWDRVRIIGNEKLDGWIPSAFLSDRAAKSSSPHGG